MCVKCRPLKATQANQGRHFPLLLYFSFQGRLCLTKIQFIRKELTLISHSMHMQLTPFYRSATYFYFTFKKDELLQSNRRRLLPGAYAREGQNQGATEEGIWQRWPADKTQSDQDAKQPEAAKYRANSRIPAADDGGGSDRCVRIIVYAAITISVISARVLNRSLTFRLLVFQFC